MADRARSRRLEGLLLFSAIHIKKSAIHVIHGDKLRKVADITDILFLDIQMPGLDGMEAARKLRASGKKTVIIFVTALEEYVFKAFDVGAFLNIKERMSAKQWKRFSFV